MIIEVDSKLLNLGDINMNQLVFLSMVLDKNQTNMNNQDVRKLVSLISDDDISYLAQQGLITSIERGKSIIYEPTEKLTSAVKPPKDYFDLFYDMYPVMVLRPDGTNSKAMAEHINDCLKFELQKRTNTGKLNYIKTMWRWLVDHAWEEAEEEMNNVEQNSAGYGTELI